MPERREKAAQRLLQPLAAQVDHWSSRCSGLRVSHLNHSCVEILLKSGLEGLLEVLGCGGGKDKRDHNHSSILSHSSAETSSRAQDASGHHVDFAESKLTMQVEKNKCSVFLSKAHITAPLASLHSGRIHPKQQTTSKSHCNVLR